MKTIKCTFCGDNISSEQVITLGRAHMCHHCADERTRVCSWCGTRIWNDDNMGNDSIPLCGDCYDAHYTRCERCNRLIHFDNACYEDGDDVPYCEDCYNDIVYKVIHEYSYKPEPVFYGSGSLYMGVELEIDDGGCCDTYAQRLLDIANRSDDHIYCKYDGSIDDGFELVSHPMTPDYHINTVPWQEVFSEARIISNSIIQMVNGNEYEESRIPFFNGYDNGNYYYLTDMDQNCDIRSPFFDKRLIVDNADRETNAHRVLEIVNEMGNNGFLALSLMIYGLFYTLFQEKGYELSKILYLGGNGADSIAKFLQIYNKNNDESVSLQNNIATIRKNIFNSKDELIIFKGNNEKIRTIVDIFCNKEAPEVNINGKKFNAAAKSLFVLLSDIDDRRLSTPHFYKIFFNKKFTLPKADVRSLGTFVKNVIENVMDNLNSIDEALDKNKIIAENFFDEEKSISDMALLLTVCNILKNFLEECNCSNKNVVTAEIIADFLDGISSEGNALCELRAVLLRHLSAPKNLLPYSKKGIEIDIPDDELVILHDDSYIYIEISQFKSLIVSKLSSKYTYSGILQDLAEAYCLKCNDGNLMKLSVKINNSAKRTRWVAIKRDFFEYPWAFPLIKKSRISGSKKSVLLGWDFYGKNVLLPLGDNSIANRHIGITGDSGMGKTYATLSIVKGLAEKGISSIIIDYAESFRKDTLNKNFVSAISHKLTYITAYHEKLPLDIFLKQEICVDGLLTQEKDTETALRVSHLIGRACKLYELQENAVYKATLEMLNNDETRTLKNLCKLLKSDETPESLQAAKRIEKIADADLFDTSGRKFNWSSYLNQGQVIIISLSGFQSDVFKRMIAECILQDLWGYAQREGSEKNPFAVVIDEIGATPPRANSALANMLTLGRKFGISCIWNTQFLKNKFADDVLANLQQAATRLYFRASDVSEKKFVAEQLSKTSGIESVFEHMKKGQCVARGSFYDENGVLHKDCVIKVDIPEIK